MIKENIKVLDSLRPEEARFNFNPLNRNLCFSVGAGGSGNPIENMFDAMLSPFGGSGGGGDMDTEGGLSAEDKAFKTYMYSKLKPLMEQEYESYEGDRYADRSPEELALLGQLKEGGGYKELYDKAATDLGFTQQAYKDAAGYGVDELDADTAALMGGDTYRNEVSDRILRDMNRGASMSGMDINRAALGSFAGGTHSRGGTGGTARLQSNLGFHEQAGDALTKLHYGAYQGALDRAGQLRRDRETSAGRFGQTALANLGIGKDKFGSQLGAFRPEREDRQRDLDFEYKKHLERMNFPWKKLDFGSRLFSGMPIEEKGMTQQPASGGK